MEFWTDPEGLGRLCYELFNSPYDLKLKVVNAYNGPRGPRIRVRLSKRQARKLQSAPSKQDIERIYGG